MHTDLPIAGLFDADADTSAVSDAAVGDRTLRLADGRILGYREYGDPNGRPVIALHGTPGSRYKYAGSDATARDTGLRLIAPDRWGYGLSSAKENPTLAAYGPDIAALADNLRLDRFSLTGVSGGGPFAVAAAAHLGSRVRALALVSPVGLLRQAGRRLPISPFHALSFRWLPRIPGAIPAVFQAYRTALGLAPNLAIWVALSRSPAIDRACARDPETRARLIETFASGLAAGVRGPAIDMKLFDRDWNLDLSRIACPAIIWIGSADRNVPLTAVEALQGGLPNARSVMIPGAGHLWVSKNAHEVMHWLATA